MNDLFGDLRPGQEEDTNPREMSPFGDVNTPAPQIPSAKVSPFGDLVADEKASQDFSNGILARQHAQRDEIAWEEARRKSPELGLPTWIVYENLKDYRKLPSGPPRPVSPTMQKLLEDPDHGPIVYHNLDELKQRDLIYNYITQQWHIGQLNDEAMKIGYKMATGHATKDDWQRYADIQKEIARQPNYEKFLPEGFAGGVTQFFGTGVQSGPYTINTYLESIPDAAKYVAASTALGAIGGAIIGGPAGALGGATWMAGASLMPAWQVASFDKNYERFAGEVYTTAMWTVDKDGNAIPEEDLRRLSVAAGAAGAAVELGAMNIALSAVAPSVAKTIGVGGSAFSQYVMALARNNPILRNQLIQWGGRMLVAAGSEAVEEPVQGIIKAVGTYLAGGYKTYEGEELYSFEQFMQDTYGGFAGGVLFSIAGAGVEAGVQTGKNVIFGNTEADDLHAADLQLSEQARTSKVSNEFLDTTIAAARQMDQDGVTPPMFIDIANVRYLFQLANLTYEDIAKNFPHLAAELDNESTTGITGSEVPINAEEHIKLQMLEGYEDAISPFLRYGDNVTKKEADQFREEMTNLSKSLSEEQGRFAVEQEKDRIQQNWVNRITESLVASGIDRSVAATQAQILGRAYRTVAEQQTEMGMEEYFNRSTVEALQGAIRFAQTSRPAAGSVQQQVLADLNAAPVTSVARAALDAIPEPLQATSVRDAVKMAIEAAPEPLQTLPVSQVIQELEAIPAPLQDTPMGEIAPEVLINLPEPVQNIIEAAPEQLQAAPIGSVVRSAIQLLEPYQAQPIGQVVREQLDNIEIPEALQAAPVGEVAREALSVIETPSASDIERGIIDSINRQVEEGAISLPEGAPDVSTIVTDAIARINATEMMDPLTGAPNIEVMTGAAIEALNQRGLTSGDVSMGLASQRALNQPQSPTDVINAVAENAFMNPLNEREMVIGEEGKRGGVTLFPRGNLLWLMDLRSIERGGGRRAMEILTQQADDAGVAIELHAIPTEAPAGRTMTKADLRKWYEGFGFRQMEGDVMRREPVNPIEAAPTFRKRTKAAPKRTVKAYKLFVVDKNGNLHPTQIDTKRTIPVGEWLDAGKTPTPGFAERPGFHAGELPMAPQMRTKEGMRAANRVYAEVEMAADQDYQAEADASPTLDLKHIPTDGMYRFTPSAVRNRTDAANRSWMISGSMKVNRILSDEEVAGILRENGYPQEIAPETRGTILNQQDEQILHQHAQTVGVNEQARIQFDPKKQQAKLDRLKKRLSEKRTDAGSLKAGKPKNARTVIKGPKGMPDWVVGEITFDDWIKRTESLLKPDQIMKASAWYDDIRSLFRNIIPDQAIADRMMAAWLVSNQNAAVFTALDNALRQREQIMRGVTEGFEMGGLPQATEAARSVILEKPISRGVGQKISDFIDSAEGRITRAWMNDNPEGGSPFVVDIWTARDTGLWDGVLARRLAALGYDVPADLMTDLNEEHSNGSVTTQTPSETQYENRADFGRRLTEYLNRKGWQGRKDWRTYEVQAIGWTALVNMFQGKDLNTAEAIDRTMSRVSVEVDPGEGSPAASIIKPRLDALPEAERIAVSEKMAEKAIRGAAEWSGIDGLLNIVNGVGVWNNWANPSSTVQALATMKSARQAAAYLGKILQQTEVWVNRVKPLTKNPKGFAIDIIDVSGNGFVGPSSVHRLFEQVQAADPTGLIGGYQNIKDGNGRLGMRLLINKDAIAEARRAGTVKSIADAQAKLQAALDNEIRSVIEEQNFDLEASLREADIEILRNDWTENPDGQAYNSILARQSGEGRTAADIDRAGQEFGQAFEKELADAEARANGSTLFQKEVTPDRILFQEATGDNVEFEGTPASDVKTFTVWHGAPVTWLPEILVRMADGEERYIVGEDGNLPKVPEGATLIKEFPLGRPRSEFLRKGQGANMVGPGLYTGQEKAVGEDYKRSLARGGNNFPPDLIDPQTKTALNGFSLAGIILERLYPPSPDNLSEPDVTGQRWPLRSLAGEEFTKFSDWHMYKEGFRIAFRDYASGLTPSMRVPVWEQIKEDATTSFDYWRAVGAIEGSEEIGKQDIRKDTRHKARLYMLNVHADPNQYADITRDTLFEDQSEQVQAALTWLWDSRAMKETPAELFERRIRGARDEILLDLENARDAIYHDDEASAGRRAELDVDIEGIRDLWAEDIPEDESTRDYSRWEDDVEKHLWRAKEYGSLLAGSLLDEFKLSMDARIAGVYGDIKDRSLSTYEILRKLIRTYANDFAFMEDARKAGLEGVKYLDQWSRREEVTGEERHNLETRLKDLKEKLPGTEKQAETDIDARDDLDAMRDEIEHIEKILKPLTYNYVHYNYNNIDVVTRYQGPRGYVRFRPGAKEFEITLGGTADLSTFLHEGMHFILETMTDLEMRGFASKRMWQDMTILREWADAGPVGHFGTEAHERVAQGFEQYLLEGKAPTPELRGVMGRIKQWMLLVYRTMKLHVQLTDEVRGVFDRLLASDEAINEARQDSAVPAAPMTQEETHLTDEEYANYVRSWEMAREHEQALLDRKMVSEAQREAKRAWKDQKAMIERQLRKEADNSDGQKAMDRIRERDLQISPETIPTEMLAAAETLGITKKNGMDFEVVAELLGYDSGIEMMKDMNEAELMGRTVVQRAEAEMVARHGRMKGEVLYDAAAEAIHNKTSDKVNYVELEALGRAAGIKTFKGLSRLVNNWVAEKIDALSDRANHPNQWRRAEVKASAEVERLKGKKDWLGAALAQRRKIYASAMYRESMRAKSHTQTILKYLRRFSSKKRRENLVKNGGQKYLDAVDELLQRVDLQKISGEISKQRGKLAKIIKEAETEKKDIILTPTLMDRLIETNYQDMTYGELRGLYDSVRNLAHLARREGEIWREGRKENLATVVKSLVDRARQTFGEGKKIGTADHHTLIGALRWYASSLDKQEAIFSEFDGKVAEGPWWENLFKPLVDAQRAKFALRKEIKPLFDMLANASPEIRRKWRTKYDFMGEQLTGMQIWMSILNTANKKNRTKMMEGFGWDWNAYQTEINNWLTSQEEMDMAQKVWDTLSGTLWPKVRDVLERTHNVVPEKVEAIPFETKYGTYGYDPENGRDAGYFPLVADRHHQNAIENEAVQRYFDEETGTLSMPFERVAFDDGFTKGRTNIIYPIKLDPSVLFTHMDQVLHFITHYEAVSNIEQILKDPAFKRTVYDYSGEDVYNAMKTWLRDVARNSDQAKGGKYTWYDRTLHGLRVGTTIGTLYYNIKTAMKQPLGLTVTWSEIGAGWTARGMAKMFNPEQVQNALAKSAELREQLEGGGFDRDVRMITNRMRKLNPSIPQKILESGAIPMAWTQSIANIATWLGAYDKAMAQGKSDAEAVDFADAIVRRTQGTGLIKDLSSVQRGSELERMVSMYFSYFNTIYQTFRHPVDRGAMRMARRLFIVLLISGTLDKLINALYNEVVRGGGPDDEEEMFSATWFAMAFMDDAMAMFPVFRDIGDAFLTYTINGKAREAEISPVNRTIRDIQTSLAASWDWAANGEFPTRSERKAMSRTASWMTKKPIAPFYQMLEDLAAKQEKQGKGRGY